MADQPRRPNRGNAGSGKGKGPGGGGSAGRGGSGKNRGKPPRGGGRPAYGKPRSAGGAGGSRFSRPGGGGRKLVQAVPGALSLKRLSQSTWAFVPPDCALERQMDLEDAQEMRARHEDEIARDELLYIVADCHGFMTAHNELGELALAQEDVKLARGHYGYSYENALKSLPPGFSGRLPHAEGYNGPFFEAGRGLARCLVALGRVEEGEKVLKKLAQFDPEEPDTQSLLSQLAEFKAGSPPTPCGTSTVSFLPIITIEGAEEDDEDDDD